MKQHEKQMTLGEIIAELKKQNPDDDVEFDFVWFYPKGIHSFRGYYDQLAIGYEKAGDRPKVKDLLALYRASVGKVFEGYKGGGYLMTEDTAVWVGDTDETADTIIVGVVALNTGVVFQTEKVTW